MNDDDIDDKDVLLGDEEDEDEEDPLKMGFHEEGVEPEADF